MSVVTWATVRWTARRTSVSSGVGGLVRAATSCSVTSRHRRSRNRPHPSITWSVWSVQSTSSVGGPTKRWKRRSASAPTDA